jgi:hypothetical protein
VARLDPIRAAHLLRVAKLVFVEVVRIQFEFNEHILPPINDIHLSIDTYPQHKCWLDFRLRKYHMRSVLKAFNICLNGETIRLENGSVVTEEECFLFMLYRMNKITTLADCESNCGSDYTVLSRMFAYMMDRIFDRFSYLVMDNLASFQLRFIRYNERIRRVLALQSGNN